MLVSDVIADIAFFLDYGTIVIFKASNSVFLALTSKLEGQLAHRLDYALHLGDYVVLTPANSSEPVFFEETRRSPAETFVNAVRLVGSIVGPHRICQLYHARPDLMALEEVVRLVPGAKLVEHLDLCGKQAWDVAYLSSLPYLRELTSSNAIVSNICAMFAAEWALRLRYVYLANWQPSGNDDMSALENDIVRICSSASSLPENKERVLIVHGMRFSLAFVARLASAINLVEHTVTAVLSYATDYDVHWQRTPYTADSQVAMAHWTGYAEFTRMPLDAASFEEKCVALPPQTHLPTTVNGAMWIKTAYFSRASKTAVFVRRYDVVITNNPEHIGQECRQYEADY